MTEKLNHYLEKWNLSNPQKIDVQSAAGDIYIVQQSSGEKAALKILCGRGIEGEKYGAMTLNYFNGNGAVQCINYDDEAHLLEYIDGEMLRNIVDSGNDDEATEIISHLVRRLHKKRKTKKPQLISLKSHFKELHEMALNNLVDPHYLTMSNMVNKLIENTKTTTILHGDIHHENILHSSQKGWIAIDPRGIHGDPHYEVANCFNNPPRCDDLIKNPERAEHMADIFSEILGYDRNRLLKYAVAHMALSASWHYLGGNNKKAAQETLDNSKIIYKALFT